MSSYDEVNKLTDTLFQVEGKYYALTHLPNVNKETKTACDRCDLCSTATGGRCPDDLSDYCTADKGFKEIAMPMLMQLSDALFQYKGKLYDLIQDEEVSCPKCCFFSSHEDDSTPECEDMGEYCDPYGHYVEQKS